MLNCKKREPESCNTSSNTDRYFSCNLVNLQRNRAEKKEYDKAYYREKKADIKKQVANKKKELLQQVTKTSIELRVCSDFVCWFLQESLEKLCKINSKEDWYAVRNWQIKKDPRARKFITKMTISEFVQVADGYQR